MKVSDVMTESIMTCRPADTLADTAAIMRDLNVGICPVVSDDGKLVGVITDRDITVRASSQGVDPKNATVGSFMTPSPLTVDADTNVQDAAEMMAFHQVRRLPVVNDGNSVIGMVTLGDLAVDAGEADMLANTLERISEPVRSQPMT